MTATAGLMLVQQILPLITAAIGRGSVKPTGCEDAQELQAEAMAMAAQDLESIERRGKQVPASSVAYYAVQRLKSGRRSGYSGKADVLSAAASLCGRVSVRSLDEPMGIDADDPDQEVTLHDVLAAQGEDSSSQAARRLDWDMALDTMDDRTRGVVKGRAEGVGTGELALQYKISPPRICQVREAAGAKIAEVWGGNPVVDAAAMPRWRAGMRAGAERRAGRYERARK